MVDEQIQPLSFGAELRRLRTEAGLSLSHFAQRVNYSKSHLSKIESGIKKPSQALARRCDQGLGASGALARLVQPTAPVPGSDSDPDPDFDSREEVWTMRLTSDGQNDFGAYDRRSVLTAGAATLMSWAITPPLDRVGAAESTLPIFRGWLDELRRLGQSAPPGMVSQILIATTNAVQGLATDNHSSSRGEALRLASRFAEYTGWMAQEKGDETAALWWTAHAIRLATAGGDPELESYGLVRRAELALYRGDPIATKALAREAQTRSRSARIRSFAAQREAQGHAIVGDERACHRALERAAEFMRAGHAEAADGPTLGSATMTDPIAFVTAWCLQDLGRPLEAAEILDRELGSIAPDAHRTRARYGARLALAAATVGQVERACEVLRPVLDRAGTIDSATVRHDLRRLNRELGRSRRQHSVRHIMPGLTLALHSNTPEPLRYRA
ncbi:helix-turn-helix domain-containing protein [Micromonospora sp. NPDC047762]|uniref:helix-turn-helix domain-containing protein n=1 Tax=unclassified Micromonospora TaxID=2617518 RepID=UPI00340B9F08